MIEQHELQGPREPIEAQEWERADQQASAVRGIAVLFAVLALFFALAETLSRRAQLETQTKTIQASDTWAFYQARNARVTTIATTQRVLESDIAVITDPVVKAAKSKLLEDFEKQIRRLQSDPQAKEGLQELRVRAAALEQQRDSSITRFNHYQVASAALQLGMWCAFVGMISGIWLLAFLAGGLGLVGVTFVFLGTYAPLALNF
jgi:hypothetical protein